MPEVHAILSASSSKRWLNCTPSARLEQNFPNESSVYAEEGTAAHALGEYKLRKYLHERVRRPTSEFDNEEMDANTDIYAEFIITTVEKIKETCPHPLVMVEERLDYSYLVPQGFGTGDCVIIADGMKTGRNLQEVLVELDRQNKAKQDFISPAQGMRLREDGHTFELNHLTTDRQMTFGTTSLFHRQVASALGIPAKYYDLMQSQKPELLAENVNAWFADRTSSYMVRSMDYGSGQVARALLSERYRRIDNMEIATSVLPLFAGNDQYEVMSCEVTENRLYLKVVNHRLEMEVRKGDIVQAGVMISNSEVGLGAVSIQPLVYRLVCTNGMVVNDMGERRHHVGRQAKAVEDSFTLYSDETMEAEDKAFLLKLRDTTMAAIDEARFAQVVGRLQESMAVPITGKVQDVIQNIGQKGGLDHERRNTSR